MAFEMWNNFSGGFFEYAMSAYDKLEPWTYPLVFVGIIGYVYMATRSVTAAIISIFITLGLYGASTSIFDAVPSLNLLLWCITIIGIPMLFFAIVLKVVDRI
jgi:hypothetical protein